MEDYFHGLKETISFWLKTSYTHKVAGIAKTVNSYVKSKCQATLAPIAARKKVSNSNMNQKYLKKLWYE